MKFIVTTLFILCSSLLYGQIPNGGLDDWTTQDLLQLEDWTAVGNTSLSNDATDGNYAIRLENTVDNGLFGLVTNADLSQDLAGGQPYTDIPLVMAFSVKYDLAPGDIAKVVAVFKVAGQAFGFVDFTMNGNSGDTFQRINYPIQWATQTAPDSVIVLVSSIDPENTDLNGDGYLIVDDIVFHSVGVEKDEVHNPSFESWSTYEVPHPVDWYTTDRLILDQGGAAVNFESAINPSHIQSGTGAIRLRNFVVDNNRLPGAAVTGDNTLGIDKPTFAVERKWKYLHGLYKYQPENGDKGLIAATFFANGTLIGAAQFQIEDSTEGDDYVYFYSEVQYFGQGTPDSATVILASADLNNPLGDGSKLWVDNLNFTDHTASIQTVTEAQWSCYPNPATDHLTIEGPKHGAQIIVRDAMGREHYRGSDRTISTTDWSAGTYIIEVQQEGQRSYRKIVKL